MNKAQELVKELRDASEVATAFCPKYLKDTLYWKAADMIEATTIAKMQEALTASQGETQVQAESVAMLLTKLKEAKKQIGNVRVAKCRQCL